MIICHEHKFIFIKTRKTAGTSIETALSMFCGESDSLTYLPSEDESARKDLGSRCENLNHELSEVGNLLVTNS